MTNISERCKFIIKFNSTNISTGNYIFYEHFHCGLVNSNALLFKMNQTGWPVGHAYCKPIILPVHCSIGRKRITSVTIIIIVIVIVIVIIIVIIVLVSSFLSSPWSPWRPWSPWSLALRPPWSLSLWSPWSPWPPSGSGSLSKFQPLPGGLPSPSHHWNLDSSGQNFLIRWTPLQCIVIIKWTPSSSQSGSSSSP